MTDLLTALRSQTGRMTEMLAALVECESPSANSDATATCAALVDDFLLEMLGTRAERVEVEGRTHLAWGLGETGQVVLIGHLDTVWPMGTLAGWPFRVDGETATGPGSFDMKAGVIQILFALNALDDLDGVSVVLTTDEELGSPTSRGLIERVATGAKACLVMEPSADGALKTERKGVAGYEVSVIGRSAHAGLEPELGINAGVEIAYQVLAVDALNRPDVGTTVTPTVLAAGSSGNSVPASARMNVDVRALNGAEQERVDAALRGLQTRVPGTTLNVVRQAMSPPLEREASADLFYMARILAEEIGLGPLGEASVGGGSDGNLTASLGVPTLDGLGAIGGRAHAEGEFVVISSLPERAALAALLVGKLTRG
ncbi:MAG TPA: M20 family metallopeptidase [Actinomycetota bacterium]|nr:M20 family metallopeptidase [Actinomycetota bacterium]